MSIQDSGAEETMVNRALKGLRDAFGGDGDWVKILDGLPINMMIYTADGTVVFVNKVFCESYKDIDPRKFVGVYNFFKDPTLARVYGIEVEDLYRKVFKGYVASVSSTRINVGRTHPHFTKPNVRVSGSRVIQISGFPIYDQYQKMKYAVFTSYTTIVFEGEAKIVKAKEYMYENWLKDFSLDAVAKSCGFNKYYFSHFFKKQTGYTPYEYYKNIKIDKLKEMLLNPQMSIAEAFRECGLDYKGQYGRFFKESLGMTPSEYRRKALENK